MTTLNRVYQSLLASFLTLGALVLLSLGSLRTMGSLFGLFLKFERADLVPSGQASFPLTALG